VKINPIPAEPGLEQSKTKIDKKGQKITRYKKVNLLNAGLKCAHQTSKWKSAFEFSWVTYSIPI